MPNVPKPDWFPLQIHVAGPVTVEHWIRAMMLRLGVVGADQAQEEKARIFLERVLKDEETTWGNGDSLDGWLAVREMNAYQAFKLARVHDLPEYAEAKRVANLPLSVVYGDEIQGAVRDVSGFIPKSWYVEFQYRAPVLVDLALDDDTLKVHFDVWLKLQRDLAAENGLQPGSFKKVDEDVLAEWHQKRMLAAFDLVTWRALSGARYSDAAIARWLWPDSGPSSDHSNADRAERFRKVTKPLLKTVFDWHTVTRLEYMKKTEAFLRFLEAQKAHPE